MFLTNVSSDFIQSLQANVLLFHVRFSQCSWYNVVTNALHINISQEKITSTQGSRRSSSPIWIHR